MNPNNRSTSWNEREDDFAQRGVLVSDRPPTFTAHGPATPANAACRTSNARSFMPAISPMHSHGEAACKQQLELYEGPQLLYKAQQKKAPGWSFPSK